MKIVYLAAGAGGMYCGACLHANTLAAALQHAGQDVLLVPVYTPLRTDEEDVSTGRVVFGGVSVYLQQVSAVFRHTPRFVDKLLDHPALLKRLARRGSTVRPESLGATCVSVLRGEEGRQRKEVEKTVRWLEEIRPEVVHLSTVLLAGTAREIRRRLGVPVVATLSGEDTFLERLPEPYRAEARQVLRRRAGELDGLIALSRYYADFMAEYLAVERSRIEVIPPGLNLEGHAAAGPAQRASTADDSSAPQVTIGCLGRVCEDKGLHLLAEALELLVRDARHPVIRVLAAGHLAEADRPYLEGIMARLRAKGLADRLQYVGQVDRAEKIAFLRSLDVVSLPAIVPESKGLPVLEAWANGVPAVLPGHGAFVELVEDTGGGLLHQPGDAAALAAALGELIRDPARAAELGRRGHQAVFDRYHADLMARRTIALYEQVLRGASGGSR